MLKCQEKTKCIRVVMVDPIPFRTAVPFWEQITEKLTDFPPKRDCGSEGTNSRCVESVIGAEQPPLRIRQRNVEEKAPWRDPRVPPPGRVSGRGFSKITGA